jgi:hypothetical protein
LDTPEQVWDDMHVTFGWHVTEAHATIDGVPVRVPKPGSSRYRGCAGPADRDPSCAQPFVLTLDDDNGFVGVPGGNYFPTVADGLYLLLAPPLPGRHRISFGGTAFLGDSSAWRPPTSCA